jgi:hypothetical protein
VRSFLDRHAGPVLALTEFSLYSIGLAVTRLGKGELFASFIRDLLLTAGVRRIVLDRERLAHIPAIMWRFRLDFDDAYQYAAAEADDLVLVKRLGTRGLTGELRFPKERRREAVELTEEAERKVEAALRQIRQIEQLQTPPQVDFMPICRSCAYLELCWG